MEDARIRREFRASRLGGSPGYVFAFVGLAIAAANALLSPSDPAPWVVGGAIFAAAVVFMRISTSAKLLITDDGLELLAPAPLRKSVAFGDVTAGRRAQPFLRVPSAPKRYQFLVLETHGESTWIDLGPFGIREREEIFARVEAALGKRMLPPTDRSWNQGVS